MINRSYSANESITRRISRLEGSSLSVPSPAAETTRAPRVRPKLTRNGRTKVPTPV